MGHMKFEHTQPYENWFWEKNRIKLVNAYVEKVDYSEKKLHLRGATDLSYDKLIIATGSKPNKFGWPGQDLKAVQGLYSKQDLEGVEKYAPNNKICKRAVIVGGGLIGIELAEMLRSRDIPVTFLVREDSFWNAVLPSGESQLINEHILEHHIDLRLSTNLVEIIADENGRAKAVTTDKGDTIECDFVGLTAGVSPNIDFLKESGIDLGRGVKVNRYLETNIKDIYAIGDCAEQHESIGNRRPIEAVWYTGRMMGETVAQTICENKIEYKPGHWFNSAKFLDVEYQTYGWVFSEKIKKDFEKWGWQSPILFGYETGKTLAYVLGDMDSERRKSVGNFLHFSYLNMKKCPIETNISTKKQISKKFDRLYLTHSRSHPEIHSQKTGENI